MTAIYGLYDGPDAAQRAVEGLRTAGLGDRDITVISAEPFEDPVRGLLDEERDVPRHENDGGGFVETGDFRERKVFLHHGVPKTL